MKNDTKLTASSPLLGDAMEESIDRNSSPDPQRFDCPQRGMWLVASMHEHDNSRLQLGLLSNGFYAFQIDNCLFLVETNEFVLFVFCWLEIGAAVYKSYELRYQDELAAIGRTEFMCKSMLSLCHFSYKRTPLFSESLVLQNCTPVMYGKELASTRLYFCIELDPPKHTYHAYMLTKARHHNFLRLNGTCAFCLCPHTSAQWKRKSMLADESVRSRFHRVEIVCFFISSL